MFTRKYLSVLKQRLAEPRRFIQVITGPRQVGKTTMVSQLTESYKSPFFFNSADATYNTGDLWIQQQWEAARISIRQSGATEGLLVIDEIQKIPNWSEKVKRYWDEDTLRSVNIKVILLGSSRVLLQQGLTESLAGRFESMYLPHWSFTEMKMAFGWNEEQFAWFGGYPGAAPLVEDENRWKDYILHSLIEASISKDILMLTRVDKPSLMKRLFELGCEYSAQSLSYTKMLGQLLDAGNTTTLSHYLSLLHAAGLLGGLEKFSPDKIRQRASSPKFQVHNTALISAQRKETFTEARDEPAAWGRIVESTVGAHLLNHIQESRLELFYWREGDQEVDFVLKSGGSVLGIEVKSGHRVQSSGLSAFKKKFPDARCIALEQNGLSWKQMLSISPEELF